MTRNAFALVLLWLLPACSGRVEVPYGTCRASALCAEETPLCTRECATNAECPDDGVCIEIRAGAYRSLCMQRCASVGAQCPFTGGFCATVRAGDMACVP